MGNYKKIDVLNLARINNAEYLTFMNNVLNLLPLSSGDEENPDVLSLSDDGCPALGLSKDFSTCMKKICY